MTTINPEYERLIRSLIDVIPGCSVVSIETEKGRLPGGVFGSWGKPPQDEANKAQPDSIVVTYSGWTRGFHHAISTITVPLVDIHSIGMGKTKRILTPEEVLMQIQLQFEVNLAQDIRNAAAGQRHGYKRPMPMPYALSQIERQDIDHILVRKTLLNHFRQGGSKAVIDAVSNGIFGAYAPFRKGTTAFAPLHGLESVSLDQSDEGDPILEMVVPLNDKDCVFDGSVIRIGHDLPDMIHSAAIGRPVGDLIATGSPSIDALLITDVESNDGTADSMLTGAPPKPATILTVEAKGKPEFQSVKAFLQS